MRTASVAGRRPGAVAVMSITLPPATSATVAVNWPPSTCASLPLTCTAASAGVTVPRTWTVAARTEPPSPGRLSLSLTRGSVAGRGASPQAASARPAARTRTSERTRSMLAAQANVERALLRGAAARGHRHRDLQLEAVLAFEGLAGLGVERDRERLRAARRRGLEVAAGAPAVERHRDLEPGPGLGDGHRAAHRRALLGGRDLGRDR